MNAYIIFTVLLAIIVIFKTLFDAIELNNTISNKYDNSFNDDYDDSFSYIRKNLRHIILWNYSEQS